MNATLIILVWLAVLVFWWPLALAALILVPVLWLLSLPIRLVIWAVEAVLALVKGILFLPARMLGFGPRA